MLLRTIGKWLNAGVLEDGSVTLSRPGHAAGRGDLSAPGERLPARSAGQVVRGRGETAAARARVPRALRGRLRALVSRGARRARVMECCRSDSAEYGLTLHPDKTRLVRLPAARRPIDPRHGPRAARPGTFDLLGFTHYWGRSRKGQWVVKRKTAKTRLRRALRAVAQWCRRYPARARSREQHRRLVSEAQRSLRLLRDHRERQGARALPRTT